MQKNREDAGTTPIATRTRVPPDGHSEKDEDEDTADPETDLIPTRTRVP